MEHFERLLLALMRMRLDLSGKKFGYKFGYKFAVIRDTYISPCIVIDVLYPTPETSDYLAR